MVGDVTKPSPGAEPARVEFTLRNDLARSATKTSSTKFRVSVGIRQ